MARIVSYKKRNEFLTNKRVLKNIDGRQHVVISEDLTPLRYKLLKCMQKSCSDTFTVATEPRDERNLSPGFIQLRTPARINICSATQRPPGTKLETI